MGEVERTADKKSYYDFQPDKETTDELKFLKIDSTDCEYQYQISNDCKQPFLKDSDVQKYLKHVKLKDAGYSWIVLGALIFSNVLTAGYVKSFGIIYNGILIEFPQTSEVMGGVLIGLLAGCRSILAPFASAVATAIGVRRAMVIGTTLCFLGLTSSIFCTSVLQLSLTLGAMMGCGFCIIETSQVIVISNYFEGKLSFANGMRVSGNPLGGMLYPFLLLFLFNTFGVNLMRIILAGLILNLLVCMALIRPPAVHKRIQMLDAVKKIYKEDESPKDPEFEKEEKFKIYEFLTMLLPDDRKTEAKKGLEFHYLTNLVYWIFLLVSFSVSFSLPICVYYLPVYAREIGLTGTEISFLLTFQSMSGLCLRILMGYINDKKFCKTIHCFILCLTLGGIGLLTIPLCTNLVEMVLTTSLFSFGGAGYFSFISVILIEQFGKKSIGTTFGFVRMVQGIFNFIIPPLLGLLIDASGSFTAAFIVMGLGMFTAAGFLLIEPIVVKLTKSAVVIT